MSCPNCSRLRFEPLEDRRLLSVFAVTNTDDDGAGSFRQAIGDANDTLGIDTIEFNISGGGLQTISPSALLPDITDPVIIDGSTQPGFAGTPLIEIDGSGAGSGDGLVVTAGGSTVRGLVINGFSGAGIVLRTAGGNTIQGNYIGTNAAGDAALANEVGINIDNAPNNLIGGTTEAARNVISGNQWDGVDIWGSSASGNDIQGNYIGTNVSGTGALGNAWDGVWIDAGAHGNTIGGTSTGARNIISGNLDDGIQISGGSSGNTVLGNYIGTDATGSVALGNDGPGVYIAGNAFGNTVGGTAAGAENVISANGWEGINIEDLSPLTAQWESGVGGNGHFYLPTLACTWAEAESLAVQLGGHLAAITSAEEQEFLTSTFGRRQVWMGLTDEAVEGTWV